MATAVVARVRNFGWWCHQEVSAVIDAWTVKGPKPKIHDDAVARLRKDWPRLADTLDALDAAEARGCPQCPAEFPQCPAEFLECHLPFGHDGPHRHEYDDRGTLEWERQR
jgi:hypothetical protein